MTATKLAALVVSLAATLLAGAADAYPLSSRSKSHLKRHFARLRHTTVDKVVELKVYNLKQAPDVIGFVLGRHKSRDGKWTHAAAAFYYACGKGKHCATSLHLDSADKIRAIRLLDLNARETRIAANSGPWFAPRPGELKEPPKRARWPVLVVQTEQNYDGRQTRHVYLISLKTPRRPKVLAKLETLSTRPGGVARSRRAPRRPPSRFNGTRLVDLRVVNKAGKPPQLLVKEQIISSRFNRCARPRPQPITYDLKEGRFVARPRKWVPGCR